MKIMRALLLAALSWISIAHGSDAVFDRSEEIDKYKALFNDGPRGVLAVAAKEIYVSGLSDRELSNILRDRLLKDYGSITTDREDVSYLVWGVKALASFGIEEHREALLKIQRNRKVSQKVRSAIDDDIDRIAWHRRKNEIMTSARNHKPGDNPRVSRYLNLILDEDFTYKYQGADRINWERLLDARVLDEMAAQLVRYKNTDFPSNAGKAPTKTLGLYAKLLGHSGDRKYREQLQQVADSASGVLIKKHAREALERLE